MELWLDTSDYKIIRSASDLGVLTGVTTNPSILSKVAELPETILKNLLEIQAGLVAVQVTQHECTAMLKQARTLAALNDRIIVKIPACDEGFKVIGLLANEGIATLATTVFETKQVVFSALLGASYVAPYLGRLPGDSNKQMAALTDMQTVIKTNNYPIKIMAAAIRSCEQFVECARLGVAAVTLPPSVYQALFMPSAEVSESLNKFNLDWLASPYTKKSRLFVD